MVWSVPNHPLRARRSLRCLDSQHRPDLFRGSVVGATEIGHVRVSLALLHRSAVSRFSRLVDFPIRPKIIQTLLIPGCSFFNAIPSIHLHLLLRNNPPALAICFSSIFAIVYFVDSVLMLSSCSASAPLALRRTECPAGTPGLSATGSVSRGIWAAMGATGLVSAVGYSLHAGMAFYVRSVLNYRKAQGLEEAVDPDEQEAERQKARELWIKMANRDIL